MKWNDYLHGYVRGFLAASLLWWVLLGTTGCAAPSPDTHEPYALTKEQCRTALRLAPTARDTFALVTRRATEHKAFLYTTCGDLMPQLFGQRPATGQEPR